MRIALQMDPLSTINTRSDSSWMMILEALRRGYAVYHYHPDDLSLGTDTGIRACMTRLTMAEKVLAGTPNLGDIHIGAPKNSDLKDFDAILMRQDPPFDMHYLSATYILERLPSTVVVNDPREVRNAPEKIMVMDFPELMPPTLISSDIDALCAFRDEHQDVIMKPLYGNGGVGIFHLRPEDDNFRSLFEMHHAHWHSPIQMQKFLPEVFLGDKRILLINGKAVGAIDRVPAEGQVRANMHVGGQTQKAGMSVRDREICASIGPKLRKLGMIFVGIDVIGGLLTEINVTSPTGIQEINRFDGACVESELWDAIVEHRQNRDNQKPQA
ncbi:MAG: glutathione synthase [Alphaproteobacteria bacterium]|nr:glutathione synthase [Alphaproteobacteria bacterium]